MSVWNSNYSFENRVTLLLVKVRLLNPKSQGSYSILHYFATSMTINPCLSYLTFFWSLFSFGRERSPKTISWLIHYGKDVYILPSISHLHGTLTQFKLYSYNVPIKHFKHIVQQKFDVKPQQSNYYSITTKQWLGKKTTTATMSKPQNKYWDRLVINYNTNSGSWYSSNNIVLHLVLNVLKKIKILFESS